MSSDVESITDEANRDIETIEEGNEVVEVQRDNSDEDDENKKVVEPKPKRIIRNPQPKLNAETLKGPRGIAAVEKHFERVKFKGKGHEEQDLNVLLKTYEYWCHRLFPKFPFDDCVTKIETLGHKKAVQTHLKRIRYDLILDENDGVVNDDDVLPEADSAVVDQFEELFPSTSSVTPSVTEEQLEKIRENRERAERIRQERLRKIREKAEASLETAARLVHEDSQSNEELDIEDILDVVNSGKTTEITNNLREDGSNQDAENFDKDQSTATSSIGEQSQSIKENGSVDMDTENFDMHPEIIAETPDENRSAATSLDEESQGIKGVDEELDIEDILDVVNSGGTSKVTNEILKQNGSSQENSSEGPLKNNEEECHD